MTMCSSGPLGRRVIPSVVKAMMDDKFLRKQGELDYGRPAAYLIELVEWCQAEEAIPALERWARFLDREYRQAGIITLGQLGRPACIAPLQRLCEKSDEALTSALVGIHGAIGLKQATPEFRTAMFDMLRGMMNRKTTASESIPHMLLMLDRQAQLPLVLDPALWKPVPDGERVRGLISACTELDVVVPEDLLMPLVRQHDALPEQDRYPGAFVVLLARIKHPDALRRAEELLRETGPEKANRRQLGTIAVLEYNGLGNCFLWANSELNAHHTRGVPEPVRFVAKLDAFLTRTQANPDGAIWK